MKTRMMNFNGDMVRGILDGRKTQTRRPVQPSPGSQSKWLSPELLNSSPSVTVHQEKLGVHRFGAQLEHPQGGALGFITCPFGQVGDRILVRETARVASVEGSRVKVIYAADGTVSDWIDWPERLKPVPLGHCMPNGCAREFARIELEITGVRVERLCDISEEDAKAEGFSEYVSPGHWMCVDSSGRSWEQFVDPETEEGAEICGEVEFSKRIPDEVLFSAKTRLFRTWDSIYAARDQGSEDNPFVWVVEFKVVRK